MKTGRLRLADGEVLVVSIPEGMEIEPERALRMKQTLAKALGVAPSRIILKMERITFTVMKAT